MTSPMAQPMHPVGTSIFPYNMMETTWKPEVELILTQSDPDTKITIFPPSPFSFSFHPFSLLPFPLPLLFIRPSFFFFRYPLLSPVLVGFPPIPNFLHLFGQMRNRHGYRMLQTYVTPALQWQKETFSFFYYQSMKVLWSLLDGSFWIISSLSVLISVNKTHYWQLTPCSSAVGKCMCHPH